MIAQNTVKVNGKWFYAGQEITGAEKSTSDFSQYMNPPEEKLPFSDVELEEPKQYTKTEINRMPTVELKKFAKEQNVENADELTGAELKKILINKLGL